MYIKYIDKCAINRAVSYYYINVIPIAMDTNYSLHKFQTKTKQYSVQATDTPVIHTLFSCSNSCMEAK